MEFLTYNSPSAHFFPIFYFKFQQSFKLADIGSAKKKDEEKGYISALRLVSAINILSIFFFHLSNAFCDCLLLLLIKIVLEIFWNLISGTFFFNDVFSNFSSVVFFIWYYSFLFNKPPLKSLYKANFIKLLLSLLL